MPNNIVKSGFILLLATTLLTACQANKPAPAEFAFLGVNVVDLKQETLAPDQTLLIGGNKIVGVGPFSELTVAYRTQTVYARGQYVIHAILANRSGTLRAEPTGETFDSNQIARLVLLSANPLDEEDALHKVEGAYQDGRWLSKAALKQVQSIQ